MANPSSRQSLKKRRTHDRIIASASRIVRKNGLAAASVSRVMHGAGLTIGGFYALDGGNGSLRHCWTAWRIVSSSSSIGSLLIGCGP